MSHFRNIIFNKVNFKWLINNIMKYLIINTSQSRILLSLEIRKACFIKSQFIRKNASFILKYYGYKALYYSLAIC